MVEKPFLANLTVEHLEILGISKVSRYVHKKILDLAKSHKNDDYFGTSKFRNLIVETLCYDAFQFCCTDMANTAQKSS